MLENGKRVTELRAGCTVTRQQVLMVMPDTLLSVRNAMFEEKSGCVGSGKGGGFGASGGRESAAASRDEASETECLFHSVYSSSLDRLPCSTVVMPRAVLR